MIDKDFRLSDIAKSLNLNKQHISYYVRKLKKCGYIKKITDDTFKVLELTQSGKNFVDQYTNKMQYLNLPMCRAENVRFIAHVHKFPTKRVDWKKVQMNNWTQRSTAVDDVKVHLNECTKPTIEFLPSPIEGDNPWELYGLLYYECTEVARKLEDLFEMEIGILKMESRPEWVVHDPLANQICKYNGQITVEGLAKINASKPSRIGAFEYFDPRFAAEYCTMPRRISNIEKLVQKLLERMK
ncbi:MAG TPA: helix-turn-helix domain-containing protein [Nitrososphaeraceae archaeon]|jgi:DNA-binding MarR family transcriptional regulator